MRTVPLTAAKATFSELVDSAERTHEEIQITRNGSVAAVIVGIDEWESLQETLYWLSHPGILDDVAVARAEIDAGESFSESRVRAALAARTGPVE